MHRARPPRRDAYKDNPQDYRCACCVWTFLVFLSFIFFAARTSELYFRLNNSERISSHFVSKEFPTPMLDICELDIPFRHSVLDNFSVELTEMWGSSQTAQFANDKTLLSNSFGKIPPAIFKSAEENDEDETSVAIESLTLTGQEDFRNAESDDAEYGYRCMRFKAGNSSVAKNIIWYEVTFKVRLSLSENDTVQRQSSILEWEGVSVISDHFFRVSLAPTMTSAMSAKVEPLRMSMVPFLSPSMSNGNKGNRRLKAVGRPTYHKWTDSAGGRLGAPEDDKALLERSEFEGEPPKPNQGDDPPEMSIQLDIPNCKSLFNTHNNEVYSDILAWMTSLLAQFAIFNMMAFLFIPVHDVVQPTRFRFEFCGFGTQGSPDEKKRLLMNEDQIQQSQGGPGQPDGMEGMDAA